MREPAGLRVALLTYRGNRFSGGQGVYVRQLSRALSDLGHHVEVLSAQPYPEVDARVRLTEVPSLDLYREDNPFRFPAESELKDWIDEMEFKIMFSGHYPEPLTFSYRARRLLRERVQDFDIVHDNQCLGTGITEMQEDGHTVLATIHHPLAVDLELARQRGSEVAAAAERWYDFMVMQGEVARSMPLVLTVSETARRDIVEKMGLVDTRMRVTPLGVDREVFRPRPDVAVEPGRVFTMASANVPLKGLDSLLQALVLVRRQVPAAHLVVVSHAWEDTAIPVRIEELGLTGAVQRVKDLTDEQLGHAYSRSEVAVVPSQYEGFSLPAVQAMASGVALVATTAGALPEVTGDDGTTAVLVAPDRPALLADAIVALLQDPAMRQRIAAAALERAIAQYDWARCAERTVGAYRELLR